MRTIGIVLNLEKNKMRKATISIKNAQIKSFGFLISTAAPFLFQRSILKKGFPMLPQLHLPCPNLDYSSCAQSCQCRFGEALLFVTGLADLIFLLLDAVVKPKQRHLKIPNGDDAFLNAAMKRLAIRIRIYSCHLQNGR